MKLSERLVRYLVVTFMSGVEKEALLRFLIAKCLPTHHLAKNPKIGNARKKKISYQTTVVEPAERLAEALEALEKKEGG